MSIIWDPREVLGLYPEKGGTCVGVTKKGLGCKNSKISGADRAEASEILDAMALRRPKSRAIPEMLEELAGLTLCPRWHRQPGYSQVTEMIRKWQRMIEQHCSSIAATASAPSSRRRPEIATRSGASTAASPSESVRTRRAPSPPADALNEEIYALLERLTSTVRALDSSSSLAPSTLAIPALTPPTNSETSTALPTPPATPTQQSNTSATSSSPTDTSSSSLSRQNGTNAFLPLTPNTSTPSASPHTPCSQPHRVRRRPITEDCGVCYEPICCPDEAVWCRAQCGQNIHRECFADWRKNCFQRADERRMVHDESEEEQRHEARLQAVTCVFCRATWKWEQQE